MFRTEFFLFFHQNEMSENRRESEKKLITIHKFCRIYVYVDHFTTELASKTRFLDRFETGFRMIASLGKIAIDYTPQIVKNEKNRIFRKCEKIEFSLPTCFGFLGSQAIVVSNSSLPMRLRGERERGFGQCIRLSEDTDCVVFILQ